MIRKIAEVISDRQAIDTSLAEEAFKAQVEAGGESWATIIPR